MKYKKVDLPPHERLKSLEYHDEQQVTLKQGGTTLKKHIAPKAVYKGPHCLSVFGTRPR